MMNDHGLATHEPGTWSLPTQLTREDIAILSLLAQGLPVEAVARRLNTSDRTLRRRVKAICDRLGCHSTIQAVAWAARRGLV